MLKLYFFNVGHGDSIAINFPDDTWGVIDCNRNKNQQIPQVLDFLKRKGVKKLNFFCITHPHTDHYNGADVIIDYFKNNIDKFILYGLTNNDKEQTDITSLGRAIRKYAELNKRNLEDKFIFAERNKRYRFGEVELLCLNPTSEILNSFRIRQVANISNIEYNDVSIVFEIVYKDSKILLTGDSSVKNWNEIFSIENNHTSDILKVSHHGSQENNTDYILSNLIRKDSFAVISTDGGKKYTTIPSKNVIDNIQNKYQSKLFKTSDLTSISEISDKNLYCSDDLISAVIDITGDNVQSNMYDGVIEISIQEDKTIKQNSFYKINDYFNNSN